MTRRLEALVSAGVTANKTVVFDAIEGRDDHEVALELAGTPPLGEGWHVAGLSGPDVEMLMPSTQPPDKDRISMDCKVNDVAELRALRLVVVETVNEGRDLISLTLGCILAGGDDLNCDETVPVVIVGQEEEEAACRLAGLDYDEGDGWPGWDVILPWVRTQVPS